MAEEKTQPREHTWHECDDLDCMVCNGGLLTCTVCGQAEGTLAPSCPGVPKYTECPKCNKYAVHMATASVHTFYGDGDDNHGDPSEYEDLEAPSGIHPYESPEVYLFAHICFECGYLGDVGIEFPRDKAVNTATCSQKD